MILTLLLTSLTASAMELDVQLASDELGALGLTFEDLPPGEPRAIEVPCAEGRTCRLTATLAAAGEDAWRVSLTLEERRRLRRGPGAYTLVAAPTFIVPTATDASLFQGGRQPIVVDDALVWLERGLRLTVRVSPNDSTTR